MTDTQTRPARGTVTAARLVAAAREQLRAGGLEAVTVREVARSLRVSAPALYKHVRGREEVVDRLVATCLDEATAAVTAARDAAPATDLRARFLAASRGFTDWSRANRAEFALVFATPVTGFTKISGGAAAQAGPRLGRVFVEIAQQTGDRIRNTSPLDPAVAGPLAAWAAARGLPLTDGQVHTLVRAFGDLLGLDAVDVFGQLGFALPDTTAYLDDRLTELADGVLAEPGGDRATV